jgi:hypothetical protein
MNAQKAQLQQVDRATLRHILVNHFDDGELRDLCFDLDIAYAGLPGECTRDKARELIAFCERRGLWPELVGAAHEARPRAPWRAEPENGWGAREDQEQEAAGHATADSLSSSWTCATYYWANQTMTIVCP